MNHFLNILDTDACKKLISETSTNEHAILLSHYSINIQSKYVDGEECQGDGEELEKQLGSSLFVNDYDDLCAYGTKEFDFTLDEFEEQNYFGNDASLEISLFEYGLCAKEKVDNRGELYLDVFYRTHKEEEKSVFDRATMSIKEALSLANESWFNKEAFESYVGHPLKIEDSRELLNFIDSALSYWGYKNIFGGSYDGGIKIKNTNA